MADSTDISNPEIAAAVAESIGKRGKAKKVKAPRLPKAPKPPKPPKAEKSPKPAEAAKPQKAERSVTVIAGQAMIWLACLAVGGGALVPLAQQVQQSAETALLLQADDAGVTRELGKSWPGAAPADYLEALSERGLNMKSPDVNSVYAAAQRATKADPSRAFAWASLAYIEYSRAKAVNQAVLDDLTQSMNACPLCDNQLIRWRFNFVLANWNAMPEPMRRRAFEQADLLRWNGVNGEFLAEMKARANIAGIPFDAYRAAVNTPVRTWDLGPTPVARLATEVNPQHPVL